VSGAPPLPSAFVREALGLEPASGVGREFAAVCADSREAGPGALFVALPGERTHGFEHLEDAASRGATGAIVPGDREVPDLDLEWFPVEDPLRALGDLAAAVRRRSGARVVGITGSSGKTTVKEMLSAALSADRTVHATSGNLNSLVGLPLTILAAPADADAWVLELGANAPGEIARLTEIAGPDDAVVTTVGSAHLEKFGTVARVLEEKLDLVRGAHASGAVVVGEEPPELAPAARGIRPDAIAAGLGPGADYRPERHGWDADEAAFERGGVSYRVAAGGEHHLRDALLAAAAAEAMGTPPALAARGLAAFEPLGWRGAVRVLDGLTLVADCYNANPDSFDAAIEYCVGAFPGRPLAAVVGSMLELGESGPRAHAVVARRLLEAGFGPIVAAGDFVGAFRELAADGPPGGGAAATARRRVGPVVAAGSSEEAGRILADLLRGDEVVLVKGSRGARMERALERVEEAFEALRPVAAVAGGAGGGGPHGSPGRESGRS